MTESVRTVVVGAGQAGLATSHALDAAGIEHLVLERARVGQAWRDRWDSFCLVTPNWTFQVPEVAYEGDEPDGFMSRAEVVARLEELAANRPAPIREGVAVTSLEARPSGGFTLRTSDGDLDARDVVLATGAFQRPHLPPGAEGIPAGIEVIHSESYRSPAALPPGRVLVIGSGQTGCQIAEELHDAGRDVVLGCGKAPWMPRRMEGRDFVTWLRDTPFLEHTLDDLPSPTARLLSNPQATGRDGGHDLHFRTLAADGVTLVGRFLGVDDGVAVFAPDLDELIAFADARHEDICQMIRTSCEERGVAAPEMPPPETFSFQGPERVDLRGFGAVVFATGYRPAYASWVRFPDAFDELGFPYQKDGASSVVPGLYFMGIHFQRKRQSATVYGAGEDGALVAEKIATT